MFKLRAKTIDYLGIMGSSQELRTVMRNYGQYLEITGSRCELPVVYGNYEQYRGIMDSRGNCVQYTLSCVSLWDSILDIMIQ